MFFLPLSATAQKTPKTVRDFFNLLPEKYFVLEGCDKRTDKNCDKARNEYVQNFLEIEDKANGYWKSGCDGGQACLQMALFKRPNGTYLVAVKTDFEMDSENYFLEYKSGKWFDIAKQSIPNFSKNNYYELPQKGTTVRVYRKKLIDSGVSDRGEKLYDLIWTKGKFAVKK